MADVQSPSYPGYPAAPSPQQGALTGDPLRLIGALRELQEYGIRQQQAPALAQQPAAALAGQNISNVSAQQEQDAQAMSIAGGAYGALSNLENPTADDVHNRTAWLATATHIPSDRLNAISEQILKDPQGIKHGAANFQATAMGPAAAASRTPGPPGVTGAPQSLPLGAATIAGAVPTGPPMGAEASSGLMQADAARAGNFGQEIYPWQQALQKLQALGPGGTGPGTKGRQDFESFLYGISPSISGMLGVNPEKIQNYAEAEKYLTNATQQRAAGFGSHTDAQLATALSGSPNVHINDLAATDVTKAAIALRRMEHAQYVQNSGTTVMDPATGKTVQGGPINYSANKAKWASSQDPRAYALDLMTPAQVTALNKSLTGAERAKFNASLKAAQASGVLSAPQSSGPAQ